MNKVAEVTPLAAHWPMVIFAWDSSIIADINHFFLNLLHFCNLFNILIFENLNLAFDALNAM
jgi:hypothetical protein